MEHNVEDYLTYQTMKDGVYFFENALSLKDESIDLYLKSDVETYLRKANPQLKDHILFLRVSKLPFQKVLDSIKFKILEISIQLEKKGILGEEWEFTEKEKLMAININNFQGVLGDVNGGVVNQTNKVEVKLNDFDSLALYLKKYGLEISQIQELRTIIEDNPSSQSIDGYGDRLKGWLGSLGGSVSTELVVEAIKTFSGF